MLFRSIHSDVLTVAATSAEMIDGDLVKQIVSREDFGSPAFQQIVQKMREIRTANRRPDLKVLYIYAVRPTAKDPENLEVVVDASDDVKIRAYPGDLYPEGNRIGIPNHLNSPWMPQNFVSDRWGTFLSAYAPIYGSDGKYVATLGVNLSAAFVSEQLDHLALVGFASFLFTLVTGFLIATFLSQSISYSVEEICNYVRRIGQGDLKVRIPVHTEDEFALLSKTINGMAKGLEAHERLKLNFVRYVSKHVLEKILKGESAVNLKGERRRITVLFSDIREFTRLSEKMAPEEVVSLLNEYLARMLNVIFAHNGTLDKFIGDGLMVEFGAPLEDAEQEKNAVLTAIGMQKALQELGMKWAEKGRPVLKMGIGIHTGYAVVGDVGSEKRMEYTAIGDTVNVASRLEKMTKDCGEDILISEATMEGLQGAYPIKNLGPTKLPGRDTPISVYAIERI